MRKRLTSVTLIAVAALAAGATPAAAGHRGDDGPTLKLGQKRCDLIPVPTRHPTAAPFGTGRCPGVRPGALVESRVGFCTMNFLFRGRDGSRYIGTAGHCILGRKGERTWGGGGPVAKDSRGRVIGRFSYAALRGEKDFALIRLNARGRRGAEPSMCHFGGPTGVDRTRPTTPVTLEHFGQGIVTGTVLAARTFTANGMRNRDHVFAQGTVAPGDSGGPVTRGGSGRGVGLVVTTGFHFDRGGPGTAGITRLPPQTSRAESMLGEQLRIVQARQR
jgi:hypothetical protein